MFVLPDSFLMDENGIRTLTPIGVRHPLERFVSQDTGVVHNDINSAKGVDCSFDYLVAVQNIIVVGGSFSTWNMELFR